MREREPVFATTSIPEDYPDGLSTMVKERFDAWCRRRGFENGEDVAGSPPRGAALRGASSGMVRALRLAAIQRRATDRLLEAIGQRETFTVHDLEHEFSNNGGAHQAIKRGLRLGILAVAVPFRSGRGGAPAVYRLASGARGQARS